MRARLALQSSGIQVALREILLRDKPQAFLEASPSATVPCLIDGDRVIDESLDIMIWSLEQNDPDHWLHMPHDGWSWVARCDGPFKHALDRTKYASRYPEEDAACHRAEATRFLIDLDAQIDEWMFRTPTLADFAVLPFVRQFAFIDKALFDALDLPSVHDWLDRFLQSDDFEAIMKKFPQWHVGEAEPAFP